MIWTRRLTLAKRKMMIMANAPARDDAFMARVEEIVRRNLANVDYGVDDLSRDLSMSRMNMYRRFQAESSVTPSEFIRLYRLRRASELLRTTTKSVTEIAYEVGFTSPQYLAKCFRDEFGITPRQARGES
ncbi:MAG: helix-turn-helix transcriptional regulator [Bacteroidales bacterium]|nr:helix-turn-helix transcriptional regulator [Bacteroidales bacterium]